jgi:bifunctional non-homologous end joining protein LigD
MRKHQQLQVDGRELTVSNLDKVYFPESGFTKGEVIAFYTAISEIVIPHLYDRPLTLKRYPEGVTGEHFYEKNAPSHTPEWVKRAPVPRSEGEGEINYVLCNDKATLIWATNLGDIEKHVLLAKFPDLNFPTALVFDLDPGEPAGIIDCCAVALELKKVFEALKLDCFVKVSGSKGLHISVPLNSKMPYEVAQPFAKTVAELMAKNMPDRVVADMAKSLRKGKVLIDWSQNSDFKTTVAVYAMRAKRGEPFISMPVTWQEVAKAVKSGKERPLFFTPGAAIKRIKKLGDLFAPVLSLKQKLPAGFSKALAAGPPPKLSRWPRNSKSTSKDKSLSEYAAKRDHSQTPEPPAKPVKKRGGDKGVHRFVIQKHQASHLHYDFRLEMQGVLRSWAVPKGPPTKPREARLAMHVEDHPMEYADFEGTIPPGNYGAGTVMVWDQGEYEDITGNPAAAYHHGKMHLVMRGKKLTGEWILLKDRREEDDSNKWLLLKAGTAISISAKLDDTSVISGRSMDEITEANDRQWKSGREAAPSNTKPARSKTKSVAHKTPPSFIEPMQCKPVPELPEEGDWLYEIKFDGYRCLALKSGAKVKLLSRNNKTLSDRFPAVVEAVAALHGEFIIDGEVVAVDEQGKHSFQLLQNSVSEKPPVLFYCFDLLNLDGEDLLRLPIEQRKARLQQLVEAAEDPLRLSATLEAEPSQIVAAVTQLGMEGVVAKRKGSFYEPGERSGAWVKHRTNKAQEFVIGGYIPAAHGFEALLVGVYEKKKLLYVGKVRNGFVPRIKADVFAEVKPLVQAQCPFTNLPEKKGSRRWGDALTVDKMAECRWVKPTLVCQVAFVEWTDAWHLRHCSFIAMRDDKPASQVVRET